MKILFTQTPDGIVFDHMYTRDGKTTAWRGSEWYVIDAEGKIADFGKLGEAYLSRPPA